MGGVITMSRLHLHYQKIKILNTVSPNSKTMPLIPCRFNKTMSLTTIDNQQSVFNQTVLIYNTHQLHFLTFSLLFLPLAFFLSTILDDDVITLLQTLTTLLSTVTATALVTYTTHQAIRRKPITFSSAFKSLKASFLPLLSTFFLPLITLISLLVWTLVCFRFGKIALVCCVAVVTLLCVVTWGLAPPIAVLEGKYGFNSLRECVRIQSGRVWFEFFKLVSYMILAVGGNLLYSARFKNKVSVSTRVVFMVVCAIHLQATLIMLNYVVFTVVLYVNAKAASGGEVVVKTRVRLSRERVMVPGLGWPTLLLVICNFIETLSLLLYPLRFF